MSEREEIARLTGALAAHLERARRKGQRRFPRPGSALPETAEAADARPLPSQSRPQPGAPAEQAEMPRAEQARPLAPSPAAEAARIENATETADRTPETALPPSQDTKFAASHERDLDRAHAAEKSPPEPLEPSSVRPAGNRELAESCSDLPQLRQAVAACQACELCKTRKNTVFQSGTGARRVLFIGEAPGADEDESGEPFVGRAGQLLTDIITKGMKLTREEVAIANVLKCRTPENRDPSPLEKERCTPFLDRQIELLDPEVLITLGRHASNHILGTDLSMGRLRGRVHSVGGRKVVATYHPAYLLRSPSMKRECWADIQIAMRELGLPT